MPKFNKANINELKNYLYNNYIHDAKMECVSYNCQASLLDIRLFNPIYNTTVAFTFHHVSLFLAIEGDNPGKQEEIFSLSVEENFSCLHQHIQLQYKELKKKLYLFIQMFSGNEWHVICDEITVDIM